MIKRLLLTLTLVFAVFVGIVVVCPEVVVNSWTLKKVVRWLKLDLKFTQLDFKLHSLSIFKKEIDLKLLGFCYGEALNAPVTLCGDELSFHMAFHFEKPILQIEALGPLVLKNGIAHGKVILDSPVQKPSQFHWRSFLPKDFKDLKLGELSLDLQKWTFKTFKGSLNLKGGSEPGGYAWQGKGIFSAAEKLEPSDLDFGGILDLKTSALQGRVKAHHLCPNFEGLRGCLDTVDVGAKLSLGTEIKLAEIKPLILTSKDLEFRVPAKKDSDEDEAASNFLNIRFPVLPSLELKQVLIDLPKIMVRAGSHTYQGQLLLKPIQNETKELELGVKLAETSLQLKAALQSHFSLEPEPRLQGTATVTLKANQVQSSFNLKMRTQTLAYEVKSDVKVLGVDEGLNVLLGGTLRDHHIDGVLDVKAHRGEWNISSLTPCGFALNDNNPSFFDCGVQTLIPSRYRFQDMPQALSLHFGLHLRPATKNQNEIKATVALNPVDTSLISLHGNLNAELQLPSGTAFSVQVLQERLILKDSIQVSLVDFKKFIQATYGTPFAPPAPLNALSGTVQFESKGSFVPHISEIPLSLKTELSSAEQNLFLRAEGRVSPTSLKGEVNLDQIKLVLPKLKYAKPPTFIPDPRIEKKLAPVNASVGKSAPKTPSSPSLFSYSVAIQTAPHHPLLLVSNLAKAPIPITLALRLENNVGPRGDLRIEEFPVELFRRNAVVKYFDFGLHSDRDDENPIKGDFLLAFSDYNVHILLSGTAKAPVVKLESDPPLPENQILAVVIFGKNPDDLDSEQNSSVQSMQAAIADRALALSSLFLLASTPIESVGYDSQEKMFTAKVKLAEGVSLDLGSDSSDLKEVGVNKRLGKSWYIRAYVTNPTNSDDQSVTAFLEKLFRY